MDQIKIEKLLSIKEVSYYVSLGKSNIWTMVKRGSFPAPRKISVGCTRWKLSEIQAFINGTWHG